MKSNTRVLLVQENAADRDAIAEALTQRGYDIVCKESVLDAMAFLEDNPAEVDVVITALHLEHSTAFDILRAMKLRPDLKRVPFIFCCLRPSQFTIMTAESTNIAARVMGAEDLIIQDTLDADFIDERIRLAMAPNRVEKENLLQVGLPSASRPPTQP